MVWSTMKHSVALLATVLLSLTSAQLRNGNFENISDGKPTDWCEEQCCTCMTLTSVTSRRRSGQRSVLTSSRNVSWAGPSQVLGSGLAGKKFEVSAWVRLHNVSSSLTTRVEIAASFQRNGKQQYLTVGGVDAKVTEWRQIRDQLEIPSDVTGSVRVYLKTPINVKPFYDFYTDDVELKDISKDWRAITTFGIERHRKRDVKLVFANPSKKTFQVQLKQTKLGFPFGSAVNTTIVTNEKYRQVFLENFNYAVMKNEMKWYANERGPGRMTYNDADEMLAVLDKGGIPTRGHCIYWAVDKFVQSWVKRLTDAQLWDHLKQRAQSAVSHFRGRITHWDVNNEMLHGRYFRTRLQNENIPTWMFKEARKHDSKVKLFLNDYNILTADNYIDRYIQQANFIRQQGGDVYGLGAQAHFRHGADITYDKIKSRLDRLAAAKLPVWLTELDVEDSDEKIRADKLEVVVRTAFSHPAVEGVLLWGFWATSHWRGDDAALWRHDWSPSDAGSRWQQLMREFSSRVTLDSGDMTKQQESLSAVPRVFHGTYDVVVDGKTVRKIVVAPGKGAQVIRL